MDYSKFIDPVEKDAVELLLINEDDISKLPNGRATYDEAINAGREAVAQFLKHNYKNSGKVSTPDDTGMEPFGFLLLRNREGLYNIAGFPCGDVINYHRSKLYLYFRRFIVMTYLTEVFQPGTKILATALITEIFYVKRSAEQVGNSKIVDAPTICDDRQSALFVMTSTLFDDEPDVYTLNEKGEMKLDTDMSEGVRIGAGTLYRVFDQVKGTRVLNEHDGMRWRTKKNETP